MKHHFGDFLDRQGDYWTIVPNRDRFLYSINDIPDGDEHATIATIGSQDAHWQRVFTLPNLVELTLHQPDATQLEAVHRLVRLKRLRVTHARPRTLEFLRGLTKIEELVLEYVSGFSDLSPLRMLPRLRSLHMENLRRVSDFSPLAGMSMLQYLRIDGTPDWKQPIADFQFLRELPRLEVLSLGKLNNTLPYPALLPVIYVRNLKKISIARHVFPLEEYAFLEVALESVEGAVWEPCRRYSRARIPLPQDDVRSGLSDDAIRANHPEVYIQFDGRRVLDDPDQGYFDLLGKGGRDVKCSSPIAAARCAAHTKIYLQLKEEARELLREGHRSSTTR